MKRYKSRRTFFIGLAIILSIAILEYFLINKYVGIEGTGIVVEERLLTTPEEELFEELFEDNSGFVQNFYEDISYITIPKLLDKSQGVNNQILLEEETQNDISNEEILRVVDAEILREIFKQKTNFEYKNLEKNYHWKYNEKYDLYYQLTEDETKLANYFEFDKITIMSNNIYKLEYRAYNKQNQTNIYEGHSGEYKEELYSGRVVLKKEAANYYFVSNEVLDHKIYIGKIEEMINSYDFYNSIEEKRISLGKNYYDDIYEVVINKYSKINKEENSYAVLVSPVTSEVNEEAYYFENGELKLFVSSNQTGQTTYSYFENGEVILRYKKINNEIEEFEAFLKKIEEDSENIINRSIIIR